MVATLRGTAGHDIVEHALTALRNLDHRGATGADPLVGDGAGILTQVPDRFLREVVAGLDLARLVAGMPWAWPSCPSTSAERADHVRASRTSPREEGLEVLGWRDVPHLPTWSAAARDCHAALRPALRRRPATGATGHGAGPAAYLPAQAGRATRLDIYFPSLSARTLVYKGMLTTGSWSRSSPTCPTSGSRPSSAWCTPGSRPTPSRPGRWPTPTG
jgi:glutamate synthase (NADPH/NADH) large chain